MSSTFVWFRLVDSTGESYNGTNFGNVSISSLAVPIIDQFRKAVKAKYSNKLSSVDAGELLVFKTKGSFDKRNDKEKEEPLNPTDSLSMLGSKEQMLIVVVPSLSVTALASAHAQTQGMM
jgi:hypothetical protein